MRTDIFGKDTAPLKDKRLFLFDMDGTIYEETTIYDGTLDMLKYIKDIGGVYVFITNNSSKSVDAYIEKVRKMGIEADESTFFTSAQATSLYLNTNYKGKKVYCMGTESLKKELLSSGIEITEGDDAEVVLAGFDMELTYDKLFKVSKYLNENKTMPYIATNPDLVCPVAFGFIPDCGSMCNMIENATGRIPVYIGKPKATMVELAMKANNMTKEKTVVIGDRLYTDIACGVNAGVDTVCVLSGEATVEEIKHSETVPSFTLQNVRELYNVCSEKN